MVTGQLRIRRRVSADEAYALLVMRSQRENVNLRDLADRFVEQATKRP